MSQGDLGRLGFKLVLDDSEVLPQLRGIFARLQAEVEARGIKIPVSAEGAGAGGRPTTFAAAQAGGGVPMTMATTGAAFAPNRPAPSNLAALVNSAAIQLRGEQAWSEVQAMERQQLRTAQQRATQVSAYRDLAVRTVAELHVQGIRDERMVARRTHALSNARNDPWGWGSDPELLDEAAAMERQQVARQYPGEAARGAARGGGRGAGAGRGLPWRTIGTMGLVAAHELIRSNIVQSQANFEANIATSPAELLRAQVSGIRQSYSGFYGSIVGATRDLFGRGPEALALSANRAIAVSESQDRLRAARIAEQGAAGVRAAVASGDAGALRRAQVQANFANQLDPMQQRVSFIQSQLAETRAEQAGATAATVGYGVNAIRIRGTRTVNVLQGEERTTQQNELQTEQTRIGTLRANAGTELRAITREAVSNVVQIVRATGRAAGANISQFVGGVARELPGVVTDATALRMRANEINLAAGGRPLDARLAGIERERMQQRAAISRQFPDAPALRDPLLAAVDAEADARAKAEKSDFGFDTGTIQARIGTQARLNSARLGRLSPAAGEAIAEAGAGRLAARQLAQGGRTEEARFSLANVFWSLQATRREFLEGFQGRQVDIRTMDVTNPRNQSDPAKTLDAIDKEIKEIKEEIRKLISN